MCQFAHGRTPLQQPHTQVDSNANVITTDDQYVHTQVAFTNSDISTSITPDDHQNFGHVISPNCNSTHLHQWTHRTLLHLLAHVDIWPSNLIEIICAIKQMPPRWPASPYFTFDLTCEATKRNYMVLKKKHNGGSLAAALDSQQDSTVGYGSEFCDEATLSPLFTRHPNWYPMTQILQHGSKWPLEPLNKDSQRADVKEALAFGNHKGALLQPELLLALVSKDVHYGYCLPLPLRKVTKILDILIALMNIQPKNTIDKFGRIIPKDHLTHNQSFKWLCGTSVNSRVIMEELLPCMFGSCIRRIINWAITARQLYPNLPILASKIYFKSAFQQMHLSAKTASQTCTMLPELNILLMWLCLSFGGKLCPYMWGVFSELICDLANATLFDDTWNPPDLFAQNQTLVPQQTSSLTKTSLSEKERS